MYVAIKMEEISGLLNPKTIAGTAELIFNIDKLISNLKNYVVSPKTSQTLPDHEKI